MGTGVGIRFVKKINKFLTRDLNNDKVKVSPSSNKTFSDVFGRNILTTWKQLFCLISFYAPFK